MNALQAASIELWRRLHGRQPEPQSDDAPARLAAMGEGERE